LPVEVSIQTVHVELKKLKRIYKKIFTLTNKNVLMLPKNVKNGNRK